MVVSAVAGSVDEGEREVVEVCSVLAAGAGVALANQVKVVHMADEVVMATVAWEAAVTEVPLEVGSVDQEVMDTAVDRLVEELKD